MTPLRRKLLLESLKLFDLCVAAAAFLFANLVVYVQGGSDPFGLSASGAVKLGDLAVFFGFLVVWHAVFVLSGIYDSRRLSSRPVDRRDLLAATLLGVAFLSVGGLTLRAGLITPLFIVVFGSVSLPIVIISRLVLRSFLERVRLRGRNLRHLLIVGVNDRTTRFAQRLIARPELGYALVGYVDDEARTDGANGSEVQPLADLDGFAALLRERVVDEVVIGLPMGSLYGQAARTVEACREQGVVVRFLSSLFDAGGTPVRTDTFEEDQVVTISHDRMQGWPVFTKRLFDIVVAGLALLVLTPVMLLAALVIRLTSSGPVFFVQERVGLSKRTFPLLKFRTMVVDAEARMAEVEHLNEVSGPVFKIKNDPRITPIGRFLRRSSIDELPQLINVLRGDMSLVGPRPLPIRDYERFEQDWQRRRFSVRPGITCLWQVGGRSTVQFEQWMRLDMQYIDEWSLALDMKILLLTVPAVLRGSGAA